MDATLLACAGGFFIGTYPIFVKTRAVLVADVHPVAFQLYKSFWVAVSGVLFIALRWVRGDAPVFAFTWWAVLAALVWVPAGICLIAAVPRAGVGAGVLIFDGCTTLLSFAVGVLAFGEQLKPHATADGGVYYLAPVFLLLALLGMGGLTVLPRWLSARATAQAKAQLPNLDEPLLAPGGTGAATIALAPIPLSPIPLGRPALAGFAFAVAAGGLSALQYAIVTVGKRELGSGPPSLYARQALDPLGSWTLTFGATSLAVNMLGLAALSAYHAMRARPPPSLHASLVWREASAAGVCYALSVVTTTLAVERGGNAVVPAQRNAVSLITSGMWGLAYYREVQGVAAVGWCAAAALTMASVVMLGFEKGGGR